MQSVFKVNKKASGLNLVESFDRIYSIDLFSTLLDHDSQKYLYIYYSLCFFNFKFSQIFSLFIYKLKLGTLLSLPLTIT